MPKLRVVRSATSEARPTVLTISSSIIVCTAKRILLVSVVKDVTNELSVRKYLVSCIRMHLTTNYQRFQEMASQGIRSLERLQDIETFDRECFRVNTNTKTLLCACGMASDDFICQSNEFLFHPFPSIIPLSTTSC